MCLEWMETCICYVVLYITMLGYQAQTGVKHVLLMESVILRVRLTGDGEWTSTRRLCRLL